MPTAYETNKVIFDHIYQWRGGFGCWFKSIEPEARLQLGDLRLVRGELFAVYEKTRVDGSFFPKLCEYDWVSIDTEPSIEKINAFRRKITG